MDIVQKLSFKNKQTSRFHHTYYNILICKMRLDRLLYLQTQKRNRFGPFPFILYPLKKNHYSPPISHFLNSGDRSLLTMASSSVGGFIFSFTLDLE